MDQMARTPDPVKPKLDRAVVELLHAEVEFSKAYGAWLHAPDEEQRERKSELDAWERRIEEAMHEAQKWQAAAKAKHLDEG